MDRGNQSGVFCGYNMKTKKQIVGAVIAGILGVVATLTLILAFDELVVKPMVEQISK
jgi:hypothetical protein